MLSCVIDMKISRIRIVFSYDNIVLPQPTRLRTRPMIIRLLLGGVKLFLCSLSASPWDWRLEGFPFYNSPHSFISARAEYYLSLFQITGQSSRRETYLFVKASSSKKTQTSYVIFTAKWFYFVWGWILIPSRILFLEAGSQLKFLIFLVLLFYMS